MHENHNFVQMFHTKHLDSFISTGVAVSLVDTARPARRGVAYCPQEVSGHAFSLQMQYESNAGGPVRETDSCLDSSPSTRCREFAPDRSVWNE